MNHSNGEEDSFAGWAEDLAAEDAESPREIAENKLKQKIKDDKTNPFLKLAIFVNPLKQKQNLINDIREKARLEKKDINDQENAQIKTLEKEILDLENKVSMVLEEYKSQYPEIKNLTVEDAEIMAAVYTKEVFGQLYYNFDYIRSGQEPQKQELGELLVEGDKIFAQFKKLKGKKDIFKI